MGVINLTNCETCSHVNVCYRKGRPHVAIHDIKNNPNFDTNGLTIEVKCNDYESKPKCDNFIAPSEDALKAWTNISPCVGCNSRNKECDVYNKCERYTNWIETFFIEML